MAAGVILRQIKDAALGTFNGKFWSSDGTGTGDHMPMHILADPTTLLPADLGPTSAQAGAVTESAPATDTASSGLNGRLQRIAQRLTSLIGLLPAGIGPQAKAGSLAVTTATDDPTLALYGALTETAPATDTASSGQNGRLQRIAQRLTSLIALFPSSLGAQLRAGSLSVTLATDDPTVTQLGSLTETAPASDTASSGLNGRLQRIAQRLTSLLAGYATFGSITAGRMVLYDGSGNLIDFTASSPVTLAAGTAIAGKFGIDQTTQGTTNAVVPLAPTSIACAQASVTTTSAAIVAARSGRRAVTLINEGTTPVRFGAGTVTTANGALLPGVAGASITLETAAAINGLTASGTATVSIVETF